ncbi:MAG: iron-sulfur cluster repair di-iron protein [Phycisphaerae bacterium]|jgi:regulator of cell morphogenesis and NO signaling|nr:iron-sulfur cluster repair di-iron protein [Phycisphaerae bacterium]MBT5410113.1 iron-sulfur cluster repair di-iron protein [Phycisphaerae bacterium]
MTLKIETPVGEIASQFPLSTRVFARHKIDFCCGGGAPLQKVCEKHGLDVHEILSEINAEVANEEEDTQWNDVLLTDLIQHIVSKYHASLKEELPRLEMMAVKVNKVHGEKDPVRLQAIETIFSELKTELLEHMIKEEQILFPMIAKGQFVSAVGPISVMEAEHDSAGESLKKLRELTNDFTPPEGACNTWLALWHGLSVLEKDMHQHIHLENNILFTRALNS